MVVPKRKNKLKKTIVCLFVPGVTQGNEDAVWVQDFIIFTFGVNQRN